MVWIFLASFHETTCSFLIKRFSCDLYVRCLILLTLFHSHILLKVLHPISEWFHLLSDNTGKNWVEAYFQIEIQVKFILKSRVCLSWLPLFTHIEFWWHEKFLSIYSVFELELILFAKGNLKKKKKILCFVYFSIHSQNFMGIFPINPHETTTCPLV